MDHHKAEFEFRQLLDVADTLMGPQGCAWDKEQTLQSTRQSILEEACEVIDAIHENNVENLLEELGDLLYNVIFFSMLAEKEGLFSLEKVIFMIREKLIARHPHVFGDTVLKDAESIVQQWERIKAAEATKRDRKSAIDGIPRALPALFYAQKLITKMEKAGFKKTIEKEIESEEQLGEMLWEIVTVAKQKKINAEVALRKIIKQKESQFREWEDDSTKTCR